mmetsp:Transcript_10692/g.35514  ORF Transcript_10692/g.35514 Transcript_10692/m.35514 type:complete len:224 (-) Transcript_10692:206-877(-)
MTRISSRSAPSVTLSARSQAPRPSLQSCHLRFRLSTASLAASWRRKKYSRHGRTALSASCPNTRRAEFSSFSALSWLSTSTIISPVKSRVIRRSRSRRTRTTGAQPPPVSASLMSFLMSSSVTHSALAWNSSVNSRNTEQPALGSSSPRGSIRFTLVPSTATCSVSDSARIASMMRAERSSGVSSGVYCLIRAAFASTAAGIAPSASAFFSINSSNGNERLER